MSAEAKRFPLCSTGGRIGSIPWPIAEVAYLAYAKRYGTGQSLERIAERGGFYPEELDKLHPTWRAEIREVVRLEAELHAKTTALLAADDKVAELLGKLEETNSEILSLRHEVTTSLDAAEMARDLARQLRDQRDAVAAQAAVLEAECAAHRRERDRLERLGLDHEAHDPNRMMALIAYLEDGAGPNQKPMTWALNIACGAAFASGMATEELRDAHHQIGDLCCELGGLATVVTISKESALALLDLARAAGGATYAQVADELEAGLEVAK